MLAPLCYFVVCFTLQQCNQFAAEFSVHSPGSSLDIFYWELGAEHRVPSSALSMDQLMDSYPELSRWRKLAPVSAMHWMPYYHYYNLQHDSAPCQYYVKFTADVRFAGREPEHALYPALRRAEAERSDAVISLEPGCEPSRQMRAFNAVINLHEVMQMLTYYQLEAQRQPVPIYPEDHLDTWLQHNPEHLRSASLDLTACSDATTLADEKPFYKVLLRSPVEEKAAEEARAEAVIASGPVMSPRWSL